jgi:RNA polymerase sigma-70 factor (ECF subfamily)
VVHADPARHHEGREVYSQIAAALSALPRRQREAFTLRVLEELDVATTAQVMGCSEGSVKTHLSRARDALKRQLEAFR